MFFPVWKLLIYEGYIDLDFDWSPECDAIFDGRYDIDIEDQFNIMLILAYVQLGIPVITLIASCIQARMEVSFRITRGRMTHQNASLQGEAKLRFNIREPRFGVSVPCKTHF